MSRGTTDDAAVALAAAFFSYRFLARQHHCALPRDVCVCVCGTSCCGAVWCCHLPSPQQLYCSTPGVLEPWPCTDNGTCSLKSCPLVRQNVTWVFPTTRCALLTARVCVCVCVCVYRVGIFATIVAGPYTVLSCWLCCGHAVSRRLLVHGLQDKNELYRGQLLPRWIRRVAGV